jgi:hypothetical protein
VGNPPVLIGGVPGKLEPMALPMLLPGAGTPISGLTPALPSSVAPSGIVPAAGPAADGDRVVPAAAAPVAAVAQLPDVMPTDPVALSPPPSKVEPAPDADMLAEPLAMPREEELELQVGDMAGLRPPESISVAPSPMPALDPVMPVEPIDGIDPIAPTVPGMPSGDAGGVGVVSMVCAAAAPQLNRTAIVVINNRRIETSCSPHNTCRVLFSYMELANTARH